MLTMYGPVLAKSVQSLGRAAMNSVGSVVGRSGRESEREVQLLLMMRAPLLAKSVPH